MINFCNISLINTPFSCILGPYAHLFHRVHEQTYLSHVMAYAACIGPYQSRKGCNTNDRKGLEYYETLTSNNDAVFVEESFRNIVFVFGIYFLFKNLYLKF